MSTCRLAFDPSSIESYRTFLKVKSLPVYRFRGRTAEFPAEYAARIGVMATPAIGEPYEPLEGLFDYQADISRWAIRKRKFAAFVRPGLGKTLIEAEFARHAASQLPSGKKVLWLAPPMVVPQTIEEIQKFYGWRLAVQPLRAAELSDWLTSDDGGRIGITNYEALKETTPQGRLGAMVMDECFAAGTLVDTEDSYGRLIRIPIEKIRVGQSIRNARGIDRVSDVHCREVQYAVIVNCGKRITCSPNHPFFTQRGWVGAQDLEPGDAIVHAGEAMRMVWDGIHARQGAGNKQVLQQILLSELADAPTRARREDSQSHSARENQEGAKGVVEVGKPDGSGAAGENSGIESYVQSDIEAESIPRIEGDEPQTFRAWGERAWFDSASTDSTGCTWTELDGGISFVTGPAESGLSHSLQARLSQRRNESRYRSGWSLALLPEGSGPKEGCDAGFTRVESIEILEQGHPELEKLRDANGKLYFYDIGATQHPSFSVAGLLVHNSSMMKSAYGKWARICLRLGKGLDWKFCGTGTPAPNDRIEYANHAVFLDQFPTVNSFLAKFFVNRGQTQNRWEMKPHALRPFYRALSHWCIFVTSPGAYGWSDNSKPLPPIHIHIHDVAMTPRQHELASNGTGTLFGTAGGITSRSMLSQIAKGHLKGEDIPTAKPEYIRSLIESWPGESTLVWCRHNAEQDAMEKVLPNAGSIQGSTPIAKRIEIVKAFQAGKIKEIIAKPDILGFGLNLQIATRHVHNGLNDSYEEFWQCTMRSSRVGSKKPLNVHIPLTLIERPMVENVLAKSKRVDLDAAEQEQIFLETGLGQEVRGVA